MLKGHPGLKFTLEAWACPPFYLAALAGACTHLALASGPLRQGEGWMRSEEQPKRRQRVWNENLSGVQVSGCIILSKLLKSYQGFGFLS